MIAASGFTQARLMVTGGLSFSAWRPEELDTAMTDNGLEKRNILYNALGESLWGFSFGLAAPLTVMPLLVERLGGSKVEIGLIASLVAACTLLPQIASTFLVQRGEGRKRFLILYHWVVMIPPWAAMGVVMLFLAEERPFLARMLLFACFATFMMTIGFVLPVWVDWVAGLFRKEKRGVGFGLASFGSALAAAAAAVLAGRIVGRIEFPLGHAALFLSGSAFFFVSMLAYLPARERGKVEVKPRLSTRELFGRFRLSLSESNFRRYLVSRLLLTAGSGPAAFFAMHFKSEEGGGVVAETVVTLGAVLTLSQALSGVLLGRMGDRFGHKAGAVVVSAAQVCSLAAAVYLTGTWACGVVFALTGVGLAGAWVTHQNFLFETCPHDCRVAHITVSNLVLAPLTALVPVATGKMISIFGVRPAIGICLIPSMIGVAWLMAVVKEPRTIPAAFEG